MKRKPGTWIIFLRGVNVGGRHIVPMARLREVCQVAGFSEVRTHLQSGNIVVTSSLDDPLKVAVAIRGVIEREFGFGVEVMVRSVAELRSVVDGLPMTKARAGEPARLVVGFLHAAPAREYVADLERYAAAGEEIIAKGRGRELYGWFGNGLGTSKLAARLMGSSRTPVTVRNWNTVTKVLAIAEGEGEVTSGVPVVRATDKARVKKGRG
ncbi:MAG: DUF1697 domain-containing protein [Gemmatimonadota bacterium]